VSRTERDRITDALSHIDALHRHLDRRDLPDETVADAVSMRLAAAIDALRTPDGSLEGRLFGEDWQFMWAMRNRLTHGYITVDLQIVEATISGDLPDFERTLRAALDKLD
jgi:uncharacterized protein with HEPN domain